MGGPALIDGQATTILSLLNDLKNLARNSLNGGVLSDGGTTQASGAGTALNFDVDVTALDGLIDGVPFAKAAAADVDSDAGISFGATSAKDVTYAVVVDIGEDRDGGSAPTITAVPSAAAATDESVPPTESAIDAAIGHAHWALLGDVVVSRTADTSVTLAFSYARRGMLGSKVGAGRRWDTDLATTEAAFRSYAE